MNDDKPLDPVDSVAPAEPVQAPPPAKAPPETPGSLIRKAREALQLSIDELAGQTKLARPTLEALERDDFAALLEPVYVRGYYRKVAKVLSIPEAPLMKAYEMRVIPRALAPPTKLRLGTGADFEGGRRFGSVLIVALFAVLAGIVIWYVRGGPATKAPTTLPVQSAVTADVQSTPAEVMSQPAAQPGVAPAATVPADPATTVPQPAAPAAVQNQLGTAAATGVQLQLNFVSISWARVEDANRRVLLNRVVQAGERQVLDGLPPYTVFLGNAPGVQVQYQGAQLDIKPLTRDNATARFVVPLVQP